MHPPPPHRVTHRHHLRRTTETVTPGALITKENTKYPAEKDIYYNYFAIILRYSHIRFSLIRHCLYLMSNYYFRHFISAIFATTSDFALYLYFHYFTKIYLFDDDEFHFAIFYWLPLHSYRYDYLFISRLW
jgi:hypothetical protein